MIITITPNPAIDHFYWVNRINEPETALLTRATRTLSSPGGKGINVSVLLNHLGAQSTAMGFAAGFMGHALEYSLHAQKITTNFVWTDGETRTNVVVIVKGKETHPLEVNADGPMISEMARERFFKRFANALKRAEIFMLGGSLPLQLDLGFYEDLVGRIHAAGHRSVLYASGKAFAKACALGPWISKPDLRERSSVLGKPVDTREAALAVGKELLATGSKIVIMAHDLNQAVASQMVITRDGVWDYHVSDAKAKNRVGAGDAFLGGMLYKLIRGVALPEACCYGMAASIASTESHSTMGAGRAAIQRALKRVVEERL